MKRALLALGFASLLGSPAFACPTGDTNCIQDTAPAPEAGRLLADCSSGTDCIVAPDKAKADQPKDGKLLACDSAINCGIVAPNETDAKVLRKLG